MLGTPCKVHLVCLRCGQSDLLTRDIHDKPCWWWIVEDTGLCMHSSGGLIVPHLFDACKRELVVLELCCIVANLLNLYHLLLPERLELLCVCAAGWGWERL